MSNEMKQTNRPSLSDDALDALVRDALANSAAEAAPTGLSRKIADAAMETPQETILTGGRSQAAEVARWHWPLFWPSAAGVAASAMIGFFAGTGQLPVNTVTEPLGITISLEAPSSVDPWEDVEVIAGLTGGSLTDFSGTFEPANPLVGGTR